MKRIFRKICSLEIILGLIIISLGVISNARAASLVSLDGKSVIIHDVNNSSFRAVWMVDQALTSCSVTVSVYTDDQGTTPATFNLAETNWKPDGIVQIQVTGLQPGTDYYVKTSTEINGSTRIEYPQASPYLHVKTEISPQASEPVPPASPNIVFTTYSPIMDTVASEAVYILVEIEGVHYPIAGGEASWQHWDADYEITDSIVKTIGYVYGSDGKYLTISGTPKVTIYCLGGINQGYKVIKDIDWNPNVEMEGFSDMPDGVDQYGTNFIVIAPVAANQPPKIDSIAKASGSDIIVTSDGKYVIKPGQKFTLEVTGSDPDAGESISAWALKNAPDSAMTITRNSTNPTKAQITWSTVSNVIKEYTVTVEASNDKTGSKTFTVWVTDGKPLPPTLVVVAPASPKTGDNITCTVTGGVDPLGDPVVKLFTWFKNGTAQSGITGETVSSSLTAKGDTWSCSVSVTDNKDGESAATASNTVTIANTTPTGNPTVNIGPANPTTNSDLTATVSISGCSDADGDPLGYTVKWFKNDQETSNTATTLPASQTKKGESWVCKATLTEAGAATANIGTSTNALTIGNMAPSAPGNVSIEKVANGIQCTVGQAATDSDVNDTIKYIYKWTCTVNGTEQAPVTQGPVADLSNTLSSSKLAKNQIWHCEVAATDDNGTTKTGFVRNLASQDVSIVNNSPTQANASVSPASPYKESSLVCTLTGQSSDPDGDTVTYSYEWFKDAEATAIYTAAASSSTSSTLPGSVALVQGSQYTCKVTPSDGQGSGPSCTTAAVTIGNRIPTVVIKKGGQTVDGNVVSVNENDALTLELAGSDADSNALTCTAPTAPSGSTLTGNVFTWTTAAGSAGMYQATFKVEETDGKPTNLSATRNIQIQVIYPSKMIEDFEYPSTTQKPEDNGWFRLQGQGQMSLLSEVLQDNSTNHYLKTITSYNDPSAASATGQLQYIATKWLGSPLETQEFPELQFTIADRNLYYVEVCIHAIDNSGQGKNYFLRYIPQNPANNVEFTVSGLYINWFIGNEYIDPVGRQVKRNMEKDLNLAIAASQQGYQVHYDYLMGIVLRGDIDYFDNVAVAKGTIDFKAPKDVENLIATVKDKAVILSWTLPADQDADMIGYQVETVGIRVDKVDPVTKTNFTITGLTNSKNYTFSVKAFDNAAVKDNSGKITGNVSVGVSIQAVPKPDKTAPTWADGALSAISQNKAVMLTWTAPKDPDLDSFEIFKNEASVAMVPQKTATTNYSYQVGNLENGRSYNFTVRAYDNASPSNYSEVSTTATPETPVAISVDDFNYTGTGTPLTNGWFRLQGTGSIDPVADGSNSYMKLTTSSSNKLNFVAVKWIDKPEECNNPEVHFNLKSSGDCSIEFYILASNGNKYFMSYRPDVTKDYDYCDTPDKVRQGLYITHYLGWKGRTANSEWRTIVRNLDQDIQDAAGLENVTFKYLLGITIRGECAIDNIQLEKAVPNVIDLIARPGNGSVELSWASPDQTMVKEFRLSVDGDAPDTIPWSLVSSSPNEYSYRKTDLTNEILHTFKITQVMNDGLESNGVEVSAIPRQSAYTDDCSNVSAWIGDPAQLGTVSTDYDSEIHSNVISILPNADAMDIYYAGKSLNASGRVVTLNVKSESGFWIWFNARGSNSGKLNLLYVTGGTTDAGARIGNSPWIYTYLGPSFTDGKWNTLTLNLSYLMQAYYDNDGPIAIESITIGGGDIRVDDITIH